MRGSSANVFGRLPVLPTDRAASGFDYDGPEFAVLVLVDGEEEASHASALLNDARAAAKREEITIATPPRRGIEFFADLEMQPDLDRWWGDTVPRNALPIYLANHHDSLVEWMDAVDGHFFVSIPNRELESLYSVHDNVTTVVSPGDPHDLVAAFAPACGLPAPRRAKRSQRDRSGRFQRVRLDEADELAPIVKPAGDTRASEAFFTKSGSGSAQAGDDHNRLAEDLIHVLGEAIRGLQRRSKNTAPDRLS